MRYPVYESYKDSGVEWLGEVPEHWAIARIKHAAVLESGHTVFSAAVVLDVSSRLQPYVLMNGPSKPIVPTSDRQPGENHRWTACA